MALLCIVFLSALRCVSGFSASPALEAKSLLAEAQKLREEARVLEGELVQEKLVLEGKNNILPVVVPAPETWRTQLWVEEETMMRTSWTLLEGGRATIDVLNGGDVVSKRTEHAPGWRFLGPSRAGFECWFFVEHASSETFTKYVLETSATCEALCHTLKRFDAEAKATFEACQQRVRDIEAKRSAGGGFNPKLVWDLAVAVDELKASAAIYAEFKAAAERTKGAALDVGSDGIYTLGERGVLTMEKAGGEPQAGTFAGWRVARR